MAVKELTNQVINSRLTEEIRKIINEKVTEVIPKLITEIDRTYIEEAVKNQLCQLQKQLKKDSVAKRIAFLIMEEGISRESYEDVLNRAKECCKTLMPS